MIKILFYLVSVGLNILGISLAYETKNVPFGIWCGVSLYYFIWQLTKSIDLYLEKN